MKGRPLWHYTVVVRLAGILQDQVIQPARAGIGYTERPAVWLSTNPFWEETANKGGYAPDGTDITLTRDETARTYGGLARIEVGPDIARGSGG
jgi:hypothetical protein